MHFALFTVLYKNPTFQPSELLTQAQTFQEYNFPIQRVEAMIVNMHTTKRLELF